MLTAQQVIPFLEHDDVEVRQHAVLFLAGAHDPATATADDFWRAIDKLGPENAASHLDRLELLPQTDASIARTLAAIPTYEGYARQSLLRVIRSIDLDLLRRHRDAIGAVEQVPADINEHLDKRLALADEPVEPLWDRLMAQATELGDKELTEADALAAERLIEPLARRPDLFADRAVELLRDPSVKDWREVVVTDLVGEMKLRRPDAIDVVIDKLRDQDGDILWETASEALVRIGDEEVVRRLAERFPQEEWGFRISAAGVLGRIKLPAAEAAIVRLLPGEADKEVVTFLAASLLDLVPTDAGPLDNLRQLVVDERYEPATADLRSVLAAVAQMVGYDLPEAQAWRRQRDEDRKRWESGATDADGIMAGINAQRYAPPLDTGGPILGIPPGPRPLPPLRPAVRQRSGSGRRGASNYVPAQRVRPFRNPTAKVGRNDPCPCGSGKKFKKCCGN
jgi:hypothetical protein